MVPKITVSNREKIKFNKLKKLRKVKQKVPEFYHYSLQSKIF